MRFLISKSGEGEYLFIMSQSQSLLITHQVSIIQSLDGWIL